VRLTLSTKSLQGVGAFDSFDEVASGNAQAYIAADYYWTGKHPAWAYFTAVPFGMVNGERDAWLKYGGGQALWDELAAEFDLKCLPCGSTGVQMGGWFNKEMNSADDFKGLKSPSWVHRRCHCPEARYTRTWYLAQLTQPNG